MFTDATTLNHLSQVISHALAPAFLLGAVAAFVSILVARMNGVIDRIRTLNTIADDASPRSRPVTLLDRGIRTVFTAGVKRSMGNCSYMC